MWVFWLFFLQEISQTVRSPNEYPETKIACGQTQEKKLKSLTNSVKRWRNYYLALAITDLHQNRPARFLGQQEKRLPDLCFCKPSGFSALCLLRFIYVLYNGFLCLSLHCLDTNVFLYPILLHIGKCKHPQIFSSTIRYILGYLRTLI